MSNASNRKRGLDRYRVTLHVAACIAEVKVVSLFYLKR